MIARSTDSPVVVAAITPEPWPPNPIRADEEYLKLQREAAEDALSRARSIIGYATPSEFLIESGHSVAAGLVQVTEEHEPGLVVLGSTPRGCRAGCHSAASRNASCTVSTPPSASPLTTWRSLLTRA